jgi:hypothetical protein
MSTPTRPKTNVSRLTRDLAITTLLSAVMLVGPGAAVRAAQDMPAASSGGAKAQAVKEAAGARGESVEERITNLHDALHITPDEEGKWNAVAQAMRDNAANMRKLAAERKAEASQNRTAVDDLKTYSEFAQAHVDGLKSLTDSFTVLYEAMPDAQKKIADQVFRNYRPDRHHRSANRPQG